ncbi:DJ-1/PfpI family protein, partial [Vibrio parahaemolyticus V-223/04]
RRGQEVKTDYKKTIQQLMYSSTRILWLMMESSPQTAA